MVGGFGEYVVYVDEAGDHGRVSPEFPVFVLAFCIFKKQDYASTVLPAVHGLKFRYFGHDAVVLHEREIRKAAAPFEFLRVPDTRASFMDELSRIIEILRAKFWSSEHQGLLLLPEADRANRSVA